MRIAMVSEHASPLAVLGGVDAGGQNVHVAALSSALAASGHEVTVYTRRDDADLPERLAFVDNVEVVHVDAGPATPVPKDALLPHMRAFEEELVKHWGHGRPDIAHAHFWMSGLASLGAAGRVGVPTALTYHALGSVKRAEQGHKDSSPAERCLIEAMLAQRTDRLIATSNEEIFSLLRMGARPSSTSLVPCGVDLAHFTVEGPVHARSAARRIVVVSRLVERKGIGNVIEALPSVPGAELVIAGGPPWDQLDDDVEARRLRSIAADRGVEDRVQLLGRVERADLPALYRSADVVACTPWYEPFGLVALEAMACGVPVVASAVGGLIDTVVDGVSGVHVPPRRPDELARVLRGLFAAPAQLRTLGAGGARRAGQRYSWRAVAAETVDAYRATRAKVVEVVERVG
ncbi:MAG: glycosyl transferase, group 1 [Actinomycetia bacterium]|nr:glycosyl transferase, group 1 [Actinomycetes bacterium]